MQTSTVESEGESGGVRLCGQVLPGRPVETAGGSQVPGPLREDRSIFQSQMGHRVSGVLAFKR